MPRVKTALPRLPARHVHRPRLIVGMDGTAPTQVTLVCAPAGYGKTLLLAEWASRHPGTTAWMSLDVDDNDDHRFWSAVLSAFASCPSVPEDSGLRRLAIPARPSRDPLFLAAVVDAVDLLPDRVHLVLDDVHELTAADPLHGLTCLVRDRPPGLHLVLGSRSDPPLPLGRMRLNGEVHEIRAGALRFSASEAEEMLAGIDVVLCPEQLRLLVEQTEGWAAGLRLAALSLREADDPDTFLSDLAGNSHAVSEYLVDEILARLPVEAVDLLRAVSVCDPVTATLAATLSGRPDAGEVLDSLEHDTSLVLSSGADRSWYRMHPLLRSHLMSDLRRRRPDLVLDLHRRAADWYGARGERVPALAHAGQAGEPIRLDLLLREHSVALIADGGHRAVRKALDQLGGGFVDRDPWLSLIAGLVDAETGALTSADVHLRRADDVWPAEPTADLMALRVLVHARRVSMTGDPGAMVRVTRDLDATFDGRPELAVIGQLARALALLAVDRQEEAHDVASAAICRARLGGQPYLVARGLTVLAAAESAQGNYRRMVALAEEADGLLPGADWEGTAGVAMSSILRAYGALLRAEPARCLELLDPALAFGEPQDAPLSAVDAPTRGLRGAALVDLGRVAEGLDELRRARTQTADEPRLAATDAMLALLEYPTAALAGHPELARSVLEWAEHSIGHAGDVVLLRARRLTAMGRHGTAVEALRPLLDGTAPVLQPWVLVEACVLDCRLALLAGRREHARAALLRALALSEEMDVLRPLAFGPVEVADLLARLLGSFDAREPIARRVLRARFELSADGRPQALTERERAVLDLLPSQRSFGEIATELAVSHSTVKTHVRAIYGKLGATSRRDAVDRARGGGLLSPGP
ncbi:helix-turn-helix transcriptional regulator [Candidatus Blastococcus massiliensis]|uniref:helix-turn-helix transcriptional regulator n=1 Tax=Candidatus Blastococcus massiliensis TaxID=1470358 RepID=UPI001AA0FD66|nr:LuxR C-terminal-related transcriptional regulator [Candidatus Blastococcus massiliensis]